MPSSHSASNPTRLTGIAIVLLLHLCILWAFQSGLARSVIERLAPPMKVDLIDEAPPPEEVPPPPVRPSTPSLPTVVMPDLFLPLTAESPDGGITLVPPQATARTDEGPLLTVLPRRDARRPLTEPEFPPTSQRLGERGTVELMLTINAEGKVIEATVSQSSGYERLDDAAVKHAVRTWRSLPGTIGGKPAAMQIKQRVTFRYPD